MGAEICRYSIVFLAVSGFGFMLLDGIGAFVKGDYIRPKTGEYAGQLGPWSRLVTAVGIRPLSVFMKSIFVLWGLTGLVAAICFALNFDHTWTVMLIINITTLWYLWMGTMSSVLQIGLLFLMHWL